MSTVKLLWEIVSFESGQRVRKALVEISSFVGDLTYKKDSELYISALITKQLVPALGLNCLKDVRIVKEYSSPEADSEARDLAKDVTLDLHEVVMTLVSIVMQKQDFQDNLDCYGLGERTTLDKPGECLLRTLATVSVSSISNNDTPNRTKGSSGKKGTPSR
jgi:hypothetical protein